MSQFRKYFVAELKGIPSVPMTHRTKPAFADHDINWEYFEVIEVAALEAAQKEIAELKTEIKGWMQKASQQEQSIVDWENYVAREKSENHKLTAALKVAEDAFEHIIEVQKFLGGSSVLQQDCEEALAKIHKYRLRRF